jgi:hypothetical protein
MSHTPRYNYLPFKPFRENLKAVVAADFTEALRWAEAQAGWGGDPLPDLFGVYAARAVRDDYPVLNLLPLASDPEQDDDDDTTERKRLLCEFETIGGDADELLEVLEIYNLALRSLVQQMSDAEWTAGFDMATRGDLQWSIGTERYAERSYDSENTYVQVGSQVLTIQYTEAEIV